MLKRLMASLVAVLAIAGLAAGCGGDDDSGSGDGPTTTAPEDARASDADVAAGLRTIDGLAKDIAAAVESGDEGAADLVEQIEPTWEEIEGTIKANDEEVYLTFEDSFAAIGLAVEDEDAARAGEVAADISAAVAAYLQAHPA